MKKRTPLGINQLASATKSTNPNLVAKLEKLWQESASLIEAKVKSGDYSLSNKERIQIQVYLNSQNKLRLLGEINGVNFVHAQLDPIIARIKTGQELEIEAFKPKQSTDPETDYDNNCRLQAMSAIYTFFRDSRIIIIPTTNNASNRKAFQREVKAFAYDFTRHGKESGEYLVLDDRSLLERTAYLLFPKLLLLDKNAIRKTLDGALYWQPATLQNPLVLVKQSIKGKVIGLAPGIKLRESNGTWTSVAQQAASFFNNTNKNKVHITIGPNDEISYQDQVWELLRALSFRPDQYHNIFYRRGTPPRTIRTTIQEELAKAKVRVEAKGAIGIVLEESGEKHFDSWDKFDVIEYGWRNYGERILPEDRQIIKTAITQLGKLKLSPTSFRLFADIGAGPNLYASMLLVPYSTNNAAMELREYSPNNRAYLTWALGKHAEQTPSIFLKLKGIWTKFEDLMKNIDPKYDGSLEKIRRLAKPKFTDIRELITSELDAATSFFVTESMTDDILEFVFVTEKVVRSVKTGGVFIITHMVESEGYFAGVGTNFPAVKLSFNQIKNFYKEFLGEDSFVISKVIDKKEKARSGYHGMAIIVGKIPGEESIASFDHMATWAMNLEKRENVRKKANVVADGGFEPPTSSM